MAWTIVAPNVRAAWFPSTRYDSHDNTQRRESIKHTIVRPQGDRAIKNPHSKDKAIRCMTQSDKQLGGLANWQCKWLTSVANHWPYRESRLHKCQPPTPLRIARGFKSPHLPLRQTGSKLWKFSRVGFDDAWWYTDTLQQIRRKISEKSHNAKVNT